MQPEANYRLLIQYDGRPFCGWQRQRNGLSVQECLEEAAYKVTGRHSTAHGAGRTDAGVHAAGQVASIKLATRLSIRQLARALNATLPPEIRIISARPAPIAFHARNSARCKTYRYLILCSQVRSPFAPWYSTWISSPLSDNLMHGASEHLIGQHDFSSFSAGGSSVKTKVRELMKVEIKRGGGMISVTVIGDGFLRHMVRIIIGTLIEVGRGKISPDEVKNILERRDRRAAGPTAPAEGLTLMRVDY